MNLTILYRSDLESCNYTCPYCPFVPSPVGDAQLRADREALLRFTGWVRAQAAHKISIFFTPRGEVLMYRWYREAMVELSRMEHVVKVVAQTNLSAPPDWLQSASRSRIALWCSYHPAQTTRRLFLEQCRVLDNIGIAHSVGMVGTVENIPEIEAMRAAMNRETYLWVNAFKRLADYYSPSDVERLTAIDPLFGFSNTGHKSLGRRCRCGSSVIAVDAYGDVRRCHFVEETKGNIYRDSLEDCLEPESFCPIEKCRCHIGYVHLEHLALEQVFGGRVLERIPCRKPD